MSRHQTDENLLKYVLSEFFSTMVAYHETRAVEQGVNPRTAHRVAVLEVERVFKDPAFKKSATKAAAPIVDAIMDWFLGHSLYAEALEKVITERGLGWMFWEEESDEQ